MTDLTKICITSTAETALKKLKKAEIGVYNCQKQGARFIFSVKDKQVKKVFAIFKNPCYNICVAGESKRESIFKRMVLRAGLVAGAAIFVILAALSNSLVLKISVTGSGKYLEPEIRSIVTELGAGEYKPFKNFDSPAATGRILSLPQVTFCNIQKRGSVLIVDVQVDEENNSTQSRQPLKADISGVVKNIVAICGTATVNVGDSVKKGDILISAKTLAGEKEVESIAAGYAEIEYSGKSEYFSEKDDEQSLKQAYASLMLGNDKIINRTHTVKETEGGYLYLIDFTCLHKLSINVN